MATIASNARPRHTELVGVRLSEQDARRLRELAAADDRAPAVLARKLLSQALRSDPEGQRE